MSNSTMIPCLYTHYINRAQTLVLKTMELHAAMEKDGADPEVLEVITCAFTHVNQVLKVAKFAKALREQQIADERSGRKETREQEQARKKAERAAAKAARASAVLPAVSGPAGVEEEVSQETLPQLEGPSLLCG